MDIYSIIFNMKVCCVFSLESPHRGDSDEYMQHAIFNIYIQKKKIKQCAKTQVIKRGQQ